MPLLRKNGPTQLHRLGGPSRLRPGLTDTDSESPLLRSARRNQRCFAGVRPEATRPSLAFHSRRWAIDYLREKFETSIKLGLELELALELCHLTTTYSLQFQPSGSRHSLPLSLGQNPVTKFSTSVEYLGSMWKSVPMV